MISDPQILTFLYPTLQSRARRQQNWFISGFLKNPFDRLFAVAEADPDFANPKKETALIMAAETYGFQESEFRYDGICKHIGR